MRCSRTVADGEFEMTASKIIGTSAIALATFAVAFSGAFVSDAQARGKRVYTQDYQFDDAKHGFEGRAAGGYYCSYQRIPKRVCKKVNGKEKCKVKGWTLRQTCY